MQLESHIDLKERVGFDPKRRASDLELVRDLTAISENPFVSALLDAAGWDMLVLNRQLQVVAANSRAQHRQGSSRPEVQIGARLGEVYDCTGAKESLQGCGSDRNCDYCGALQVILSSLEKQRSVSGECLLRTKKPAGSGAVEFAVTATPIDIEKQRFIVVALSDISHKKRHALLERIFVHDLKNALTGLIGWSDLLAQNPLENTENTASRISALARNIAEEIETHRLLTAAESGRLTAAIQDIAGEDILVSLKFLFSHHESAYAKQILYPDPMPKSVIRTDPAVLRRVLVNMITNALEATPKNGTIRIDVAEDEKGVSFSVWNEGVIPSEVAAHIFKRSFSTKASQGRGIGTYSMKVLGEDVLKGKVTFQSDEASGTLFSIFLRNA